MPACEGPSVHKAGAGRVVKRRQRVLVSVLDGWWAHVIAGADVMSEGAVAAEGAGSVYYGTISVRCRLDPRPAPIAELAPAELARLALVDPHARLRFVRLVHREVASRAPAPLGVVRVELEAKLVPAPAAPKAGAPAATARPEVLEVRADVAVEVVRRASGG